MKRGLDLELDAMVVTLIKKGLETGSFYAQHVIELLEAICDSCSETRISAAFLNVLGAQKSATTISNPSAPIKLRAIYCLERLINRLGSKLPSFKDSEKIMHILSLFLSEGSLDVRNSAKRAILTASLKCLSPIDFDRLLQRSLTDSNYEKVKNFLSKDGGDISPMEKGKSHILSNKRLKPNIPINPLGAGGMTNEEEKKSPRHKGDSPSFKSKGKQTLSPSDEPLEFEQINGLTVTLNTSNNWKDRSDAIDSLMQIAEKRPTELSKSDKFIAVLDVVSKTLNDANVKVCLKAVQALEKFIPLFKTNLEQNVTMLLSCLATNLCSTNVTLKNKADILIDLLIDTLENSCLIQPFVHITLYGNPRAKPGIILHLCDILPEVQKQKPVFIPKYVLPALIKLLEDTKIEMKTAVNKLIQTLYGLIGSSLLESVPQAKVPRILEAVKC